MNLNYFYTYYTVFNKLSGSIKQFLTAAFEFGSAFLVSLFLGIHVFRNVGA